MKLIYTDPATNARVWRDSDWEQYVVVPVGSNLDDEYGANYYTDDRADAIITAGHIMPLEHVQ